MAQASNTDRFSRIAAAATLILLPLIYFFPAVLGKVTLAPGDGWTQIFGIRVLIGQMIARGEWPLWNPYIFAGMPLLASIQPGALYPPTWLFAVLAPQVAMNVLVITTYHLALFGTYLYLRRIGATRIGAVIAAIVFAFGGYMIAHLGHTNRINAAAWLPWILLAIEKLHQQARWRWVALGALFIALQLFAGEPQMTLYTGMVAGAYGLFTLLGRSSPTNRARFLAAALAMAVCGALLSMIQLLPERELLQLGDRAGIDYHYFSQYSFPPKQILSLFFPYFFGGAALPPYRVTYWGKWNSPETMGYVGLAAWALALAGIFTARFNQKTEAQRMVYFWAGCAIVALLLSFGSNLPFGIYKGMYHVPVYKLFRASGRHLMEFDFAIGVLAGLGATALAQVDPQRARRALLKSLSLVALIVGVGVILYCFFSRRLATEMPLPPQAGSIANQEVYFPIIFFILTAAALLIYARRWSAISGAIVVLILFLDLMSLGFFYEWRIVDFNVAEKLSDPASVKFIKARETDWNSFRVLSHSELPFGANSDLLDYPNISITRGLQSANGYDPVRLGQMAEIAGAMTLDGYVADAKAFDLTHQGFNLLNTKYLLVERPELPASQSRIEREGISFGDPPINLILRPGVRTQIQTRAKATELVIISAMGSSDYLADGAPVVGITLRTSDGRVFERQLQAGRDTSEWAYDRADVTARIRHRRAPVTESWDAEGFQGHRYLARLDFDRAEITSVELKYLPDQADITIARATLYDAETKTSEPLDALDLPLDRWQELAQFGAVRLFENRKAMPRAWFVTRAVVAPSAEVLQTIKTGRMKDGASFNPAEVVLLETELFGNRQLKTPLGMSPPSGDSTSTATPATVRITRYQPQRIELQANNSQPGFLVLSEIYYRGWEVWVDGQRSSVDRVNFTLRGVELPPGNHRVEFVFRAHSFRTGAAWSAVGLLLLVAGTVISVRRRRKA